MAIKTEANPYGYDDDMLELLAMIEAAPLGPGPTSQPRVLAPEPPAPAQLSYCYHRGPACHRCGGGGTMPYTYRGGVCFRCGGSGIEPR